MFIPLSFTLKEKKMNSAVIGLGYVGLPLALEAVRAGFKVWGIDVSAEKVKLANQGKSYIVDVTDQELKEAKSGLQDIATSFLAATSVPSARRTPTAFPFLMRILVTSLLS